MESIYRKKDVKGRIAFQNSEYFKKNMVRAEWTEGDYDRQDGRTTGNTNDIYIVEVKSYTDPKHPRPYSKFIIDGEDKGYQIDLDKLEHLVDEAEKENRIPLLYVKFEDYEVVWIPEEKTFSKRAKYVLTNKDGCNYGKKEWSWQSYLYLDEAIWRNRLNIL